MNNIIVYGSNYGTSKRYAEELGRRMQVEVVSYKELRDINKYMNVIYVGGLYAGGVCGMSKTLKKWKREDKKSLCIISVGLSNHRAQKNVDEIKKNIKRQLPDELYKMARINHLRGGINYTKLSGIHKVMMGLLYKKCKSIPEEQRDEETKAMIETYNQIVDFVNFDDLDAIVSDLNLLQ